MSPTTRAKAKSTNDSDAAAGTKHQLGDKKEEKTTKKQKTLEEAVQNGKDSKAKSGKDAKPAKAEEDGHPKAKASPKKSKSKPAGKDAHAAEKAKEEAQPGSKAEDQTDSKSAGGTKSASSILEKGIIYFFLRGRVNTEDPSSVSDIARTYFVLRPASSSDPKPTHFQNNHSRLLAVPKKTFPRTGRERWISFVEKAGVSFSDLKESFLRGNDYETKTRGTQHTPPAKPEGEGVYAITSTGRESHLCYILTRPEDLGEVQKKLGLKDKGSFIISTRNPEYPPPGGVGRLPEPPEFPEEIKKDFHTLRWTPTKPNHLDVEGAQILLIGESSGIEKATEAPRDHEKGEEDPREELEELAEEDEKRMQALSGDDSEAIFADLHASAKDYADMQMSF